MCIDEPTRDAQAVSRSLDSALQHVADAEVTADAAGIRTWRDATRRLAAQHGDLLEAGELAHDLLGQSIRVGPGLKALPRP